MAHNFLNLVVWQKSMELTDNTFIYNQSLPVSERYNLIDQMNRSSVSGIRTKKHFAEYKSTSLSSACELQTQLLICERRNYGKNEMLKERLGLTVEVQKMLFSFRENLNN